MLILVDNNLWIEYFKINSKFTRDEKENLFLRALSNPKNRFIVSKALIEIIEKYIEEEAPLNMDNFQMTISELSDENRIFNVELNFDSNNFMDVFLECFNNVSNHNKLALCYDNATQINDKSILYTQVQKPNYHWLGLSLSATNGGSFTLYSNDFNNDSDIECFFRDISLFFDYPDLVIQDSYHSYNASDHIYTHLNKNRSKYVKYYSSSLLGVSSNKQKNTQILKHEKNSIKSFFGNRAELYISNNRRILHVRLVRFGKIIIRCDNDFSSVAKRNQNWLLNVSYCKDKIDELESILSGNYRKLN